MTFVDRANDDYTLAATDTAAIDQGTDADATAAGLTLDLDGRLRFFDEGLSSTARGHRRHWGLRLQLAPASAADGPRHLRHQGRRRGLGHRDRQRPAIRSATTVDITNSGNDTATGVSFSDPLDPNTTLVGSSVRITPIAFDDAYSANLGSTLTVSAAGSGILANDVDPTVGTGAAVLTVVGPTATHDARSQHRAGRGHAERLADGTFDYTPDGAAAAGQVDVFTYNILDTERLNAVETGVITFEIIVLRRRVADDDAYTATGNVNITVDARQQR